MTEDPLHNNRSKMDIAPMRQTLQFNRWMVSDEYPVAVWEIEFPDGLMNGERDYWNIWKQILQVGEEEEVCTVIRDDIAAYNGTDIKEISYVDWVENRANSSRQPIFSKNTDLTLASAKISHYDSAGNVVDENVSNNLASILRQTRSDINPKDYEGRMGVNSSHNPISIDGSMIFDGCIGIELYTDIWFPRLWGYLEPNIDPFLREEEDYVLDQNERMLYKPEWNDINQWIDNRKLAQRHTPRFNRFLSRVKQLITALGAHWSVDRSECGLNQFSTRLWDENGIFLDPE